MPRIASLLMVLLLAGLLAGLALANTQIIQSIPAGRGFAPCWAAASLWAGQGLSPYDLKASDLAEDVVYGRPAEPGKGEETGVCTYPIPAIALLMPFAAADFRAALPIWMAFLEVGLLGVVLIGVAVARWKPRPVAWAAMLVFSVVWYPGVTAVIDADLWVVAILVVTVAILAVAERWDALAGILLALSTSMLAQNLITAAFILLWALGSRRWRIVIWGVIAMAVIYGGPLLLQSQWPLQWLWALIDYARLNPSDSAISLLVGLAGPAPARWSTWLSAALIVAQALLWVRAFDAGPRLFMWTSAHTLAIASLVRHAQGVSHHVVLLPVLVWVLAIVEERWKRAGKAGGVLLLAAAAIVPWVLPAIAGQTKVGLLAQLLFLPALCLLGLWWLRWWVSRSHEGLLGSILR